MIEMWLPGRLGVWWTAGESSSGKRHKAQACGACLPVVWDWPQLQEVRGEEQQPMTEALNQEVFPLAGLPFSKICCHLSQLAKFTQKEGQLELMRPSRPGALFLLPGMLSPEPSGS